MLLRTRVINFRAFQGKMFGVPGFDPRLTPFFELKDELV